VDPVLDKKHLVIIGGGPAGLRAAEVASEYPLTVSLYERNPSVGRKFLVAGRGGLNLTHSEEITRFAKRYSGSFQEEIWTSILSDCGNTDLRSWAETLGIQTFVGTSGRIFPLEKKAAPLLRSWVRRLKERNISLHTRSILRKIKTLDGRFELAIQQTDRMHLVTADAVILALGGASWPQTGSDGSWVPMLEAMELTVHPLQAANCGWEVCWNPDILAKIEGLPLKNLAVTAGKHRVLGELLITRYGLEGGALYQLGKTLRSMNNPVLSIDFKPDITLNSLLEKSADSMSFPNGFPPASWKLSPACSILLGDTLSRIPSPTPREVAGMVKDFRIPLERPRPIAEAISSAGGVSARSLKESLMTIRYPGLFLAGEMLDWEAPTGGYLLQGCFATGTRAAREAANHLLRNSGS
jgi:hypothetical protein